MRICKGDSFERVYLNEPVDLQLEQEAGSRVKIVVVDFETSRCRDLEIANRITIEQQGEGCVTEIYALAWLQGSDRVMTETKVTHAVGGGRSEQLVKYVLDGQSKGRFVGELKIAPDAQEVEAHQTNRNILLSEEAEMRTQPQLEIYADDVKATHGASTGQLDESALFYMQQRGIDPGHARQLLIGAFMKEILEEACAVGGETAALQDVRDLLNAIDGVVE